MAERIIRHLPDFYRDILDFLEIDKTETIELDLVSAAIDQIYNDQFVLSASEIAIERRERMLRIQADPSAESLDFRKKRILNRYQTKPPFTIRYLQQQLDFLVGEGKAVVIVDAQHFIFTITANIDDANVFKEVQFTVNRIKPANLIYQHNTGIEDVIELKESVKKYDLLWNYTLDGSWGLGEKPFATLGPGEVIK
ncbi:putative phage tail protein [Bacillus sp. FSL K6-3431]|uniref:putative phage tail protein n=1 Tax=Bacillus sp. FSL K6-3431 TaxID=2921500 RepID=UPI0030F5DDB3